MDLMKVMHHVNENTINYKLEFLSSKTLCIKGKQQVLGLFTFAANKSSSLTRIKIPTMNNSNEANESRAHI